MTSYMISAPGEHLHHLVTIYIFLFSLVFFSRFLFVCLNVRSQFLVESGTGSQLVKLRLIGGRHKILFPLWVSFWPTLISHLLSETKNLVVDEFHFSFHIQLTAACRLPWIVNGPQFNLILTHISCCCDETECFAVLATFWALFCAAAAFWSNGKAD